MKEYKYQLTNILTKSELKSILEQFKQYNEECECYIKKVRKNKYIVYTKGTHLVTRKEDL